MSSKRGKPLIGPCPEKSHLSICWNFQLGSKGKYLGISNVPRLAGINWEAPMNKAFARIEEIRANRPPLTLACRSFQSKALSVLGYVSQIIPPPPSFKIVELRMANKILRLATNSFDTDSAHQLMTLGGPRLPRPLAYVIACITRASFKTLNGFEAQHSSLVKAVFENECLANSAGHADNAIPDGWDSPAFCTNLLLASEGMLAKQFFPGSLNAILGLKRKFLRKEVKAGLQKAIFEILCESVPLAFEKVFARRFQVLSV
jgi:hypothetical protein